MPTITCLPGRLRHAALALVFAAVPCGAYDTARIADPEVRACADRALPSRTASQVQRVEVISRDGYVRESLREMHWKRSKDNDSRILVRMLEPADDRGVGVLVNDDADRNEISYMSYSPKIKRVRRVTGESFFGTILATDFTYEDFSFFYRTDDREQVTRVDDAVVDDQPAYVLETVKPDEDAHYSMVRFFIDKDVCLPVRTEFMDPSGDLRKELLVLREEIREVDGHWVPYHVTMIDHKLDSKSVFRVEEIEIDPELEDGLFEVQSLKRAGH